MKLNSRDLRTGNLLKGKPISIPLLEMYGNGITAITAHGIDCIERGLTSDDTYEPICITGDNLLACGFSYNKMGGWYISTTNVYYSPPHNHITIMGECVVKTKVQIKN